MDVYNCRKQLRRNTLSNFKRKSFSYQRTFMSISTINCENIHLINSDIKCTEAGSTVPFIWSRYFCPVITHLSCPEKQACSLVRSICPEKYLKSVLQLFIWARFISWQYNLSQIFFPRENRLFIQFGRSGPDKYLKPVPQSFVCSR